MLDPIDFSILKLSDCVDDELLRLLELRSETAEYGKGTIIERHGEVATHVSLIRSGLVRLQLSEPDGSLFNLSILGVGSTFGETAMFLNLPVQFDAYSETDVTISRITHETVNDFLMSHPQFARALLEIAYARAHTMLKYIGESINTPLDIRVAKFLAMMCHNGEEGDIVHCRQADLAHALGVSRVSMGKSLKALERRGLVKLGYGKIFVSSPAALESLVRIPGG